MIRIAAIVLYILVFSSCNNRENGTGAANTSDTSPEMAGTDNAGNWTANAFPSLFNRYRKSGSSFTADQFVLAAEEKQAEPPLISQVDDSSIHYFQPLWAFNRDSSKAVDLFSYNYIITRRGGQVYAEAGEPDVQASLIERNRKQQKRLLFLGPSYALFEAVWLNETEIAIAGGEVVSEEQLKPMVWKIDLNNGITEVYHYPDTIRINAEAILAARFGQADLRLK